MTYPTPEEINQIAIECGFSPSATCRNAYFSFPKELQAFFIRAYELGRKDQRERDAAIAKSKADAIRRQNITKRVAVPRCAEFAAGMQDDTYEAIRNNTGE